jgi:hypothetical protein
MTIKMFIIILSIGGGMVSLLYLYYIITRFVMENIKDYRCTREPLTVALRLSVESAQVLNQSRKTIHSVFFSFILYN